MRLIYSSLRQEPVLFYIVYNPKTSFRFIKNSFPVLQSSTLVYKGSVATVFIPSKILIIFKKSKYELDLEKHGNTAREIWKLQNNCEDHIYQSHLRQMDSRKKVAKLFPKSNFISRDEMNNHDSRDYDLIIALGGDNHFTYISHFANPTAILGCNSDTETSAGELLAFDPDTLAKTVKSGWQNARIEEWPLIEGIIKHIDGSVVKTYPCVSEITVRNNCPDLVSRYIIRYKGKVEEQKCSGLLVYTGAGSTGWVLSSTNDRDVVFSKSDNYFMVYAREIRKSKAGELAHFRADERISLTSEMDGGISIDSLQERVYKFPPGSELTLKLSSQKLKVVINEF